jgi:2-octaprenyl-6-methoxyphenol hydroxylase
MAQQRTADIVIVGAGFIGQAVALTFARAHAALGLDILLVDGRPPGSPSWASGDARSFALTATSCNMLKGLGVWPQLERHAEAMRDIKVTDSRPGAPARPSLLHFNGELDPAGPSAHMIENHYLVAALDEAVAEEPSVVCVAGLVTGDVDRSGAMAQVRFEDGSSLAAPLLVAADGRASPMRAAAGIDTVGWSYGQHGIVVTVAHERPHHGCAEEHFMPAGPFAILPLTGNRSSLVWTEESAVAEALVAGSDAAFQTALEARFGDHLGDVTPLGPRMAFPLAVQIAQDYVADRLALIGDAAHVVHPIAGLGFNLGLRDAAVLGEVVAQGVRLGLDFGSLGVLDDYQRQRRFDTLMIAAATDGLNRLFSNDNDALRVLRDLGLSLVDRAGPLKNFFVDQAVGRNSPLPAIMRGE